MQEFDNYGIFDDDYCDLEFDYWKEETDKANARLNHFEIVLKSGYYAGCQLLVKELDNYYGNRGIGLERHRMNAVLRKLAAVLGFKQFLRVAAFSNGETIYQYAKGVTA
jgi:hypothetical protein